MTIRTAPPSECTFSRSTAHATNPRSNSRTRTSRRWYDGTPPLIHSSARSCASAYVTTAGSPLHRDGAGEAAVHHQLGHRLQLGRAASEPHQVGVEVLAAWKQQPLAALGGRQRRVAGVPGVVVRHEPDGAGAPTAHLERQQAALDEGDAQVVLGEVVPQALVDVHEVVERVLLAERQEGLVDEDAQLRVESDARGGASAAELEERPVRAGQAVAERLLGALDAVLGDHD